MRSSIVSFITLQIQSKLGQRATSIRMNPIVETNQGKLEGISLTSLSGKEYNLFFGVPFAEPPTGNLRFKDPVPKKPWNGVWDATKERGIAAQFDIHTHAISGGDDCLYLNVYAPKSASSELLPVLVHIHGGGFVSGHCGRSSFDPEYFVEDDIVVVSMNYRLGVMGFLCTDPVNARGDMGLKDQHLALNWIRENIAQFNGNPDDVTLHGASAGGASVEYHVLSKRSSGLFKKAIIRSGSVMNLWAVADDPVGCAVKLAKALGYDESKGNLFEFINQFKTEDLVKTSIDLCTEDDYKNHRYFYFVPAVNQFNDDKGYIDEQPSNILKNGTYNKVPIMAGLCDKEGIFMSALYRTDHLKDCMNASDFNQLTPDIFKESKDFETRIQGVYQPRDDCNVFMDYMTDATITGGMLYTHSHMLKDGLDRYLFCFRYDGTLNFVKKLLKSQEPGACHGDDGMYLRGPFNVSNECNQTDIAVRNRLLSFYKNFIKIGNPTPNKTELINETWLPIDDKFRYLDITGDIKMVESLWDERVQFWLDLYRNK